MMRNNYLKSYWAVICKKDSQKVLGAVWIPHEDTFSFKVKLDDTDLDANKTFAISQPIKLTKRNILKLAGIYDPIRGGAAVLIKAKIAIQELWKRGLGWDADVPPDIRTKWAELFNEIAKLNEVKLE